MGNWNINIQGVGCHHNGKPDIDADLAAADFVERLKLQGHTVESASFTSGGKTDLLAVQVEKCRVVINGVGADLNARATYEEIVEASGVKARQPSVMYCNAVGKPEGILSPGQSIRCQTGTRVSVADTSNA